MAKLLSFANFNPVSLFSLILLGIGVILGAVSVGIGQWSRFESERKDAGVVDGATFKTQGLISRCISYDVTLEILELGLSLEEQPQDGCVSVTNVNCSRASLPLLSRLDVFDHSELHNSYDEDRCNGMKSSLQVSAAFMLLGIITTFFAMMFYFPLWHFGCFIAGAVIAVFSVVFYAIGLGVFAELDQDFAGFFSLNGRQQEGCLSYGFGIALAAFIINTIAAAVGIVAIFYRKICPPKHKYIYKPNK